MKKRLLGLAIGLSCLPTLSFADMHFSVGTGYPFFVVPELSYGTADDQNRWYLNGKIGLAGGASLGFEHALDGEKHHAIGLVGGALGIRNGHTVCKEGQNAGEAFVCILTTAFDWEVVNGVGLTYSYNFKGLNNRGFRIRFEGGFGEGSRSHKSKGSGSVILSYQF